MTVGSNCTDWLNEASTCNVDELL